MGRTPLSMLKEMFLPLLSYYLSILYKRSPICKYFSILHILYSPLRGKCAVKVSRLRA